jgi:hypothetical protein
VEFALSTSERITWNFGLNKSPRKSRFRGFVRCKIVMGGMRKRQANNGEKAMFYMLKE